MYSKNFKPMKIPARVSMFSDPRRRSKLMSLIRSSGNKETELELRRILRSEGLNGWRRGQKIFGRPDFVFRAARLAIFVDGCFWHGCPKHFRIPKGNRSFWRRKISRNRARDLLVTLELRMQGWRVMRIWAHDLTKGSEHLVRRIKSALVGKKS